jgi:hypothetical protein
MNIIIGSPSSGKTKKILELSAENNIPILCESPERVNRLLVKAHGYGYKIPTPVTVQDLTPNITTVYVDAIDALLASLLPCTVNTFTFNKDDNCNIIDLDVVKTK